MNYRRFLIKLLTFLGGIYFFLEFVIPASIINFDEQHTKISTYFIAVGAMAVGLGIINLLLVHGSKIIFGRKGWGYSVSLLLGLFLMLFVTLGDWLSSNQISREADKYIVLRVFSERIASDVAENNSDVPAVEVRLEALKAAIAKEIEADKEIIDNNLTNEDWQQKLNKLQMQIANPNFTQFSADSLHKLSTDLFTLSQFRREFYGGLYESSKIRNFYTLLFEGLFVPLGSAMFSLLGFYIAAAAYRAFRIKSFESGLMMLAALLVMLGQIPFGLYLWDGFPELRLWILKIPNAAAFRAIEFGAQVALLIMAFRMWLSIESESFTKEESE